MTDHRLKWPLVLKNTEYGSASAAIAFGSLFGSLSGGSIGVPNKTRPFPPGSSGMSSSRSCEKEPTELDVSTRDRCGDDALITNLEVPGHLPLSASLVQIEERAHGVQPSVVAGNGVVQVETHPSLFRGLTLALSCGAPAPFAMIAATRQTPCHRVVQETKHHTVRWCPPARLSREPAIWPESPAREYDRGSCGEQSPRAHHGTPPGSFRSGRREPASGGNRPRSSWPSRSRTHL